MKNKMYQTSYKPGTKASFFPSTATATTNGSSHDNGSSDPRRTTEGGSRSINVSNHGHGYQSNDNSSNHSTRFNKPQSRGTNGSFELNLPLRFGKKINRNIQVQAHNGPNAGFQTAGHPTGESPGISQTTKNAWQAIEFNQNRRDVNGTFAINQGIVSNNQGSSIQNSPKSRATN
jgi:hypothetical protein